MNTINTALSGLQAAATRLAGAADNTANMRTRGPVPETPPSEPVTPPKPPRPDQPRVYQAVETLQTAEPDGGVRARTEPVKPSYVTEFDPESPYANERGEVAAPNVDLAREVVDQLEALRAFRVNVSVIRTAEEMDETIISLTA
jgi:flagellar basal-body rod protein FlgC